MVQAGTLLARRCNAGLVRLPTPEHPVGTGSNPALQQPGSGLGSETTGRGRSLTPIGDPDGLRRMAFEQMWRDLAPVGRSASSGGYFRQPWTSAESELRAWFAEECAARGLVVETDGIGNQVAWWEPAAGARPDGKGVLTGSHLDSVLDGGAYDGPLGVASALAAVDMLRARGFEPDRPIGIGVFVEEEGSRFGRACLGSRLVTGATTWEQAQELRDRDGVFLADAISAAGLDPAHGLLDLDRVGTFVELHVEQGRDLVDRDVAVGLASEIWPHGRWRFDFAGQANHAGTTRMEDRHDPMLTYAMTALAANKQARMAGQRATFGRITVEPNGTNAVPSLVTAWLDARASSDEALATLVEARRAAGARPRRPRRHVARRHRGVRVGLRRLRPGPGCPPRRPRRLAGHPDPGRPRRGHPVRRRHPHRDGLRAQPDRRLALARRARRDRRLPGRRRGARRRAGRAGTGAPA